MERGFRSRKCRRSREACGRLREFVSFGVSAEVVMIVEDQDASIRVGLAEEVGSGKTADSSADDDQIESLSPVGSGLPAFSQKAPSRRLWAIFE